ncbi:TonB family protein [bacterium]|nr:TonB family protein [bacterium]
METGTKTKRLPLGALYLKGNLGRYLLQGLVVSVFLHSAAVALLGLWPETQKPVANDVIIEVTGFPTVREDIVPPPVPERIRPSAPQQPDFVKVLSVDELPLDSIALPEEELPPLSSNGHLDGTIDTGASGQGGVEGIDTSEGLAGIKPPWETGFSIFEVAPAALYEINPQPAYPELARRTGMSGRVFVWVHISEKGDVTEWHVVDVKPAGLGFEDEVARVIPKWKFTPALQQNRPVAVWVAIPFKFKVSN